MEFLTAPCLTPVSTLTMSDKDGVCRCRRTPGLGMKDLREQIGGFVCNGHKQDNPNLANEPRTYRSGSSAYTLASNACPRHCRSDWLMGRVSPAATWQKNNLASLEGVVMVHWQGQLTLSCHSTRSVPVTISVTGCSTCRRVFISMK